MGSEVATAVCGSVRVDARITAVRERFAKGSRVVRVFWTLQIYAAPVQKALKHFKQFPRSLHKSTQRSVADGQKLMNSARLLLNTASNQVRTKS